jgi:hypothetical protein
VAARRAGQLANALHLLPHQATAVDSVGIKFYAQSIRVKTAEINLNLEYVIPLVSRYLHFAETQI